MPHPKEISVPDDYYDSPDPAIIWEDLNEFWEVYWYEHGKLNARPFPVKKHGLLAAKTAAIEYLAGLRNAGRCQSKPDPQAQVEDVSGVFWDERFQSWVCLYWRNGRPQCSLFSAAKYGVHQAWEMAVERRRKYGPDLAGPEVPEVAPAAALP